jgi:hypothetical protein
VTSKTNVPVARWRTERAFRARRSGKALPRGGRLDRRSCGSAARRARPAAVGSVTLAETRVDLRPRRLPRARQTRRGRRRRPAADPVRSRSRSSRGRRSPGRSAGPGWRVQRPDAACAGSRVRHERRTPRAQRSRLNIRQPGGSWQSSRIAARGSTVGATSVPVCQPASRGVPPPGHGLISATATKSTAAATRTNGPRSGPPIRTTCAGGGLRRGTDGSSASPSARSPPAGPRRPRRRRSAGSACRPWWAPVIGRLRSPRGTPGGPSRSRGGRTPRQ